MKTQSRSLVWASGTVNPDKGGSGFENLVDKARRGILDTTIVGVVSHHANGSVRARAERLDVPFIHFKGPRTMEAHQDIVRRSSADFSLCSGYLKPVIGLDPSTTINIHPGPLPHFGGQGMYGEHVHQAVMAAFWRGDLTHTAMCMHFVTPEYDKGPVFYRLNIAIRHDDTPESLGKRVNNYELAMQPLITHLIVTRKITWSGNQADSIVYPDDYLPEVFDEHF
jgi:phosphoribosylglycinamide formyltransferase-1